MLTCDLQVSQGIAGECGVCFQKRCRIAICKTTGQAGGLAQYGRSRIIAERLICNGSKECGWLFMGR